MRLARLITVAIALGALAAACTKDNPRYCQGHVDNDCNKQDAGGQAGAGGDAGTDADAATDTASVQDAADAAPEVKPPICVTDDNCGSADAGTPACDTTGDAGARCVECTANKHCKGDKPVCDTNVDKCVQCTGVDPTMECKAGSLNVCNTKTQSCVECVGNANCSGTKPICDNLACRGCQADAECGGPGICLDTGACATDSQVLYVASDAGGCPGADGSSAKPFCNPSDAVTALSASKFVIVIEGLTSTQLHFDVVPPAPVTVVGRKNSMGTSPTIPAGGLTGIRVAAGTVTVRDLAVTGGALSSARGAQVSGAGVALTLRRVTISTGMGSGVQADTGATLSMDQCVVKGNSGDGLVVDTASYAITNSAFVANGSGVRFTKTTGTQQFVSNTIAGNAGNAATCDTTSSQTLSASIVDGYVASCVLDHSVTATATFDSSGYHLTAHLACPGGAPNAVPTYDIDGDPRSAPIDCGADQLK